MKRRKTTSALGAVIVAATLWVAASAGGVTRLSVVSGVWTEPQSGYSFIDTAIDSARTSIDLSMYELSDPEIERALVEEAKKGLPCELS